MKSYLINTGARDELERARLRFLNEFVLSLYKDAEIYTCRDEQRQLAKIKQICDWAVNDFEHLNELVGRPYAQVEANKDKYDVNFMSYVKLLISEETKRMRWVCIKLSALGDPSPEKNPWLAILTIIQIAVTKMMEADIAEVGSANAQEVYTITTIVTQKVPKVRSHMIELILATMPRSEWKAFKDLVVAITEGFTNRPPEERYGRLTRRDMGHVPEWVPEACFQLRREVESMIPDWVIDELLSENDKLLMAENNVGRRPRAQKRKSPVLQLNLARELAKRAEGREATPAQRVKAGQI